MNETVISENDWLHLREQPSGELHGTGRLQRHADGVRYFTQQRIGQYFEGGVSSTLMARDFKSASDVVVYPGVSITSKENKSNPQPGDPAPSLTNDNRNYVVAKDKPPRKYIVRRLTTIECARLQGMPDDWCEGLGGSDSAIYKAYGNGLALPCAFDVLNRIARFAEREEHEQNKVPAEHTDGA